MQYSLDQNKAKLLETLEYATEYSAFYRKSVYTEVLKSDLEGFQKLPFTSKTDLSEFNDDFLCVEIDKIKEYVTTSGTTGEPVNFYLTENDLERLAKNEADSMLTAGCCSADVFQLMTTVDKRFVAGLAYVLGVRKIGAGMVRVGPGAKFLQWDSIFKFNSTVLIAIPSFIVSLIEYAKDNQIDYNASPVKKIICIGEPIRNADFSLNEIGSRINEYWDVELISTYASTEMGVAFTECGAHKGGHLQDDKLYLEVVDEHGEPVENTMAGEVVITSFGVEGMPLIRFKTGDICNVYYDQCDCGSITPRLGPVIGRKEQMIKSKGTTLYPQSVINVMNQFEGIDSYLIEVYKNDLKQDEIKIILPESLENECKFLRRFKEKIGSVLRFQPIIQFEKPDTIKRKKFKEDKRKPIIFIDRR